jgi:hypothetical protein
VAFRNTLNVAENPVCRRCVCSLYLPVESIRDGIPVLRTGDI